MNYKNKIYMLLNKHKKYLNKDLIKKYLNDKSIYYKQYFFYNYLLPFVIAYMKELIRLKGIDLKNIDYKFLRFDDLSRKQFIGSRNPKWVNDYLSNKSAGKIIDKFKTEVISKIPSKENLVSFNSQKIDFSKAFETLKQFVVKE